MTEFNKLDLESRPQSWRVVSLRCSINISTPVRRIFAESPLAPCSRIANWGGHILVVIHPALKMSRVIRVVQDKQNCETKHPKPSSLKTTCPKTIILAMYINSLQQICVAGDNSILNPVATDPHMKQFSSNTETNKVSVSFCLAQLFSSNSFSLHPELTNSRELHSGVWLI